MSIELPSGIAWKSFVKFFREEKGYEDWTENEIELSMNNNDIVEFIIWLCKNNNELKRRIDETDNGR